MKVPNTRGAVAIAGFGRDAVSDVPFLAIASEGDGAVPLKFVRERFKATKPCVNTDWVAEVPPGQCPWPRCRAENGGTCNAETCLYLDAWLDEGA